MNSRLDIPLYYSLENLFKTLQILSPKTKRKSYSSFLAKTLICTPKITVTHFNLNCFLKSIKLGIL